MFSRPNLTPVFSEYLSNEAEGFRLSAGQRSGYRRERPVHTGVSDDFANCADYAGFSDVQVIRLIQDMHDQTTSGIRDLLTGAYAFHYKEEVRGNQDRYDSDRGNSFEKLMMQSRKKLQEFLAYLSILETAVRKYQPILAAHPLLTDLDQVLANIDCIRDTISTLQISCISVIPEKLTEVDNEHSRYEDQEREPIFTMRANQQVANAHGLPNKAHTTDSLNVFDAYRAYLEKTQLQKAVPSLLALGSLIDYCEGVHTVDRERNGVFPVVEAADKGGLRFSLGGLENPSLAWRDTSARNGYPDDKDVAKSEPFGDISLGNIENGNAETIIVVPGPNMAGKTTFMKAIGYCLHLGRMGRKVPCTAATMTIPDAIHHNFGLRDDIRNQLSTFKAQLMNTLQFLNSATIQSLGLFDELFNGTSTDYQLALAWTFLEQCAERKLRTIVSTHCRPLEHFSDPQGYDLIRGVYSTPTVPAEWQGAHGARTYSIDECHHLQKGTQRDSAAMKIAKEVFADHPNFIERAEGVLRHIRGEN